MPFVKLPLKQRIERTNAPNGFGWVEFEKIMKMPKEARPSTRSIARMYGVEPITARRWMLAWEEENGTKSK